MKMGIIGAGNIAKAHLLAAKNIDLLDVFGIYDLDYERALSFDKGVSVYSDVNKLIDEADIVVVATPNDTHAKYANLVMGKNKHILCEKPMAVNIAEAELMTNKSLA